VAKRKKKHIELLRHNLSFSEAKTTYKLIRLRLDTMTVDVIKLENGTKVSEESLPYAHLPKALKKAIKPN